MPVRRATDANPYAYDEVDPDADGESHPTPALTAGHLHPAHLHCARLRRRRNHTVPVPARQASGGANVPRECPRGLWGWNHGMKPDRDGFVWYIGPDGEPRLTHVLGDQEVDRIKAGGLPTSIPSWERTRLRQK